MRIYLIEDHELLRKELERTLKAAPGVTLAGISGSGADPVQEIGRLSPDLTVLGTPVYGTDWLSLCWQLSCEVPGMRVIVHAVDADPDDLLLAAGVGISGYVLKDVRPTPLLRSIRRELWAARAEQQERWRKGIEQARTAQAQARRAVRRSQELIARAEEQRLRRHGNPPPAE